MVVPVCCWMASVRRPDRVVCATGRAHRDAEIRPGGHRHLLPQPLMQHRVQAVGGEDARGPGEQGPGVRVGDPRGRVAQADTVLWPGPESRREPWRVPPTGTGRV